MNPKPIILLEDNPIHGRLATRFLRKKGYEVSHFRKKAELDETLSDPRIGLFVLDVQLAGAPFGGLEIAGLIRTQNPSAKILMVTAYKIELVTAEAEKAGLQELPILGKPFNNEDLLSAVRRLLGEE